MTPGEHRLLDTQIAVMVMAHKLSDKFPGLMLVTENDRVKHRVIPNYSTDLVEAFKVVEALKEMGNCCIILDLDAEGPMWSVTIKGGRGWDNCKLKGFASIADVELPEVICVAALRSMDWVAPKKSKKPRKEANG